MKCYNTNTLKTKRVKDMSSLSGFDHYWEEFEEYGIEESSDPGSSGSLEVDALMEVFLFQ